MNNKIFLDELPYKANKTIDWSNCINKKIKFIYNDIIGYFTITNYKDGYVYIDYDKVKNFKIFTGGITKCAIGKIFFINRQLSYIGKTYDDLFIINSKIECSNIYLQYKCNKCGFECGEHYKDGEYKEELWIREDALIYQGQRCACCCNRITVKDTNNISITAPWMIKLGISKEDYNKYTYQSNKKIKITCPDCGHIKYMKINNIYNNKSIGCTCGDGFSYGHKYVNNMIEQLGLKFEDNKTFEWCKFYNPYKEKETTGEYDFVLENNKLIIEVDGKFHRNDNKMSGQTKEESVFIDDEKDRLAKENGYDIIRISDEGDIKDNIMKSELTNLLCFFNVEWDRCEEFALSNRVKEACEYKRNSPEMSTSEIGYIMKLSQITIAKYLKQGTKLGWCDYDPKEEMRKRGMSEGINKRKQVEVFRDGVSLGVFESVTELCRMSEKLFGVKLGISNVSSVCNGHRKHTNNLVFKYKIT